MVRVRTRPTRQDTINQLIDGARRAFVERGFYGASIDVICASAGLTRGAFYSAFGKKEDLFFALYDRMISDVSAVFIEGLDRAARDELDPVDALFEALAGHFPIDRDWYVLNAEFTLFAIRDADAGRALAERRRALRMVIVDKLELALARSRRKTTISSELFARAVIGLAVDGLGQSLIEPEALGPTTLLQTFMAPLVQSLSVPNGGEKHGAEAQSMRAYEPAALATIGREQAATGLEPDADVRRRLLAAAQAAFLRDGYGKTRLSDIAAAAEISKKTIYAHVASKSDLFAAVVHEAIGQAVGDDRLDPDGSRDFADTLGGYLNHYARSWFSDVGIAVYGLVVSEAKQFPDLIQAYLDAARNGASAQLAALLKAKAEQGMKIVGSPESAANMLIEMVVAEPLRLAALGIAPPPRQIEIARRVEEAVTVFLNGSGEARQPESATRHGKSKNAKPDGIEQTSLQTPGIAT
jgi:AcrR family transcriptional regulator